MAIEIGGEKAWRIYRRGDIGVAFHWINGEPAMVLFPAHRPVKSAGAYVIPLDALHKYVNSNGYPDPRYCMQAALKAAEVMCMSPDKMTAMRIIDAILDSAPDLVDMPPEPPNLTEKAVKEAIGEMTIKVDGETVKEFEVETPTEAELAEAAIQ